MSSLVIQRTESNTNESIRMSRMPVLLSCAAILFTSIVATAPSMAAVCNDVTFRNHNTNAVDMKIYKVRFKDRNAGNPNAWHTEDLRDYTCAAGSDCVSMRAEDLGSRENHNLYSFQFKYAHRSGSGWGSKSWSSSSTDPDELCEDDREYPDIGAFDLP